MRLKPNPRKSVRGCVLYAETRTHRDTRTVVLKARSSEYLHGIGTVFYYIGRVHERLR